MGKRRHHTPASWFDANVKYMFLALFAVAAVALCAIAIGNTRTAAEPSRPVRTNVIAAPPTAAELNLQPLQDALKNGDPVSILGLGSSVGAGVGLEDPATDAPVAHLGQLLREAHAGIDVSVVNASVGGSTAFDGWAAYQVAPPVTFPTVVFMTYGMNDAMPFAYNAGATFPGNTDALKELAKAYRAGGSTVIVATTPSPNTGTAPWELIPGQTVLYPAGATEIDPPAASSVTQLGGVPFSVRHEEFNDFVRSAAGRNGFALVDVVPSWTAAVASGGQDPLFAEGQYNHPNLAGHQASFWPALQEFVNAL